MPSTREWIPSVYQEPPAGHSVSEVSRRIVINLAPFSDVASQRDMNLPLRRHTRKPYWLPLKTSLEPFNNQQLLARVSSEPTGRLSTG